jgi:hypothetical protein
LFKESRKGEKEKCFPCQVREKNESNGGKTDICTLFYCSLYLIYIFLLSCQQAQTDGQVIGSQHVENKGKKKMQGTESMIRRRKDIKEINVEGNKN